MAQGCRGRATTRSQQNGRCFLLNLPGQPYNIVIGALPFVDDLHPWSQTTDPSSFPETDLYIYIYKSTYTHMPLYINYVRVCVCIDTSHEYILPLLLVMLIISAPIIK